MILPPNDAPPAPMTTDFFSPLQPFDFAHGLRPSAFNPQPFL
jgi:hypothetical protein